MQSLQELCVVQRALGRTHDVGSKEEGRLPRLRLQLHHAVKDYFQMMLSRSRIVIAKQLLRGLWRAAKAVNGNGNSF